MAAGLLAISAYTPARDRNGRLVPGARMDVYANNTVTRATVYADAAMTTPLPNPVIANASGQFPAVWADGGTPEEPTLYTVAYSLADGGSIGNPSTFADVPPGVSLALVSDEAAQDVILYQRDATGSFPAPLVSKLGQQYELVDFIDRQYWATIRNYGNVAPAVFETAFAAAKAALPTNSTIGVKTGSIRFPEGKSRFSTPLVLDGAYRLTGDGNSTQVFTTSATADLFDVSSYLCRIDNLWMDSDAIRTAGMFVRLRNGLASRFFMGDVQAWRCNAFFICEGNPANPDQHLSVVELENIQVQESRPGSIVYQFDSGLAVSIRYLLTSNSLLARAGVGILATNCGDINATGLQLLGANVALKLAPAVGQTVNSWASTSSFYDNSLTEGVLLTGGGIIGEPSFCRDWACSSANGYGFREAMTGSGAVKGADLTSFQAHGNTQNGVEITSRTSRFRWNGGSAAGNAGSGFAALNGSSGFKVDAVLGPVRGFAGNGTGAYLDAGCDYFNLQGNYRGNIGASLTNNSGTGATKVVGAFT